MAFYKKMVNELMEKDQHQRYWQCKPLTNKGNTEVPVVDEINHMPDKVQAETIADQISAVSQEYEH